MLFLLFLSQLIAVSPMTTTQMYADCLCSYPNQTYDAQKWPEFHLDSSFAGVTPCAPIVPCVIFLDATTAGSGKVIGGYFESEWDDDAIGFINLYNSDADGNGGTVIMEGITKGDPRTPPPSTGPYVLAVLNFTSPGVFYITMEPVNAYSSTALPSTPMSSATTGVIETTASPGTNFACTCNYGQVWLDVIFLFDASSATGEQGLDTMWGLVGTMVDYFNIQRTSYVGTNYTTRVGIVTYGNQATVFKPLGSVNNDDLDNIFSLPFNDEPNTNLEAGLQAANAQLQGPSSRSNVKRVIVVMAASYNPTGVTAPQEVAETFKENGGILMVYNYISGHGQAVPTLQDLASPGYFFSTTLSSTYQDLMAAFCDANCFCAINYAVYAQSARGYPTQGCYLGAPITTNYRLASNKCSMFNKGFLAFDESSSKNTFLAAQLPAGSTFLIGLTFDSNYRQWMWSDGSPLGSYAPWAGGAIPNGANGATCAYVNTNGQWVAADCRNGYYYVCEAPACDSVHYCP